VKNLLINILKSYKKDVSPILENSFGKACRFTPTCSEYTIEAVEKFGVSKGILLGAKRFFRCHPFGGSGFDPVPSK